MERERWNFIFFFSGKICKFIMLIRCVNDGVFRVEFILCLEVI